MRLVLLLAPTVLLALPAVASSAQSPATPSARDVHGVVILPLANSGACPVGFEARHAQQGAVVNVAPAEKHRQQSYQITFVPGLRPAVAQARITLHGLAGAQVLPAGVGGKEGPGANESFTLSPSPDQQRRFHSTVYASELTGVQWVELNDLTYADGTTWHEAVAGACRITPNGYMLVASGN